MPARLHHLMIHGRATCCRRHPPFCRRRSRMPGKLQPFTLQVAGSSPARRKAVAQSDRAGCFPTRCRDRRRHLAPPVAADADGTTCVAGSNPARRKAVAQPGRAMSGSMMSLPPQRFASRGECRWNYIGSPSMGWVQFPLCPHGFEPTGAERSITLVTAPAPPGAPRRSLHRRMPVELHGIPRKGPGSNPGRAARSAAVTEKMQ
jgi:hypothetical protein